MTTVETEVNSLNCYPHYDYIITIPLKEDDPLSKEFVNYYQNLIFEHKEVEVEESLQKLDQMLYQYFTDEKLFEFVQREFALLSRQDEENYIALIDHLLYLEKQYEEEKLKGITSTKWL